MPIYRLRMFELERRSMELDVFDCACDADAVDLARIGCLVPESDESD